MVNICTTKFNTKQFCILSTLFIYVSRIIARTKFVSLNNIKQLVYWLSFSNYQLNSHILYYLTICMLHYNPQHVSSSTLLIFRRTNCIITASGIVTLCKGPYSMPVESGLQSALYRHTVRPFIEGDDTRGCNNTICPPEDEQGTARNMLRIIM